MENNRFNNDNRIVIQAGVNVKALNRAQFEFLKKSASEIMEATGTEVLLTHFTIVDDSQPAYIDLTKAEP